MSSDLNKKNVNKVNVVEKTLKDEDLLELLENILSKRLYIS